MPNQITDEDLDLLEELGVDTTPEQSSKYSPREERIIAGFEDIERFIEEKGRIPRHGENRDIFERLYAVRLDQIRKSEECRILLKPLDTHGLLNTEVDGSFDVIEDLSDEALLDALGIDANEDSDITQLTHVRSRHEIRAAEEVAQRSPCQDFDEFEIIFDNVQREIESGERKTPKYQDNAEVRKGDLFILDGQKLIVAEMGEPFVGEHGRPDRRLRVVYDNATESNLLLRSLQRALNKDKTSRRITTPDFGPLFAETEAVDDFNSLFSETEEEDDLPTGYIYVLRSKSDHPFVAEHRSVIHKIGVTGGDVKKRVANAKKDPTYLLADVDVVATFKLSNINRKKLEALLQKFFGSARLDMELKDRFDIPVKPQEWFLVPLDVIEQVIEKIKNGTLDQFRYELNTASLARLE